MPAIRPDTEHEDRAAHTKEHDAGGLGNRSVWPIWGGVMLVAIILPFVARSQDVVRAIATMCGFTVGRAAPPPSYCPVSAAARRRT